MKDAELYGSDKYGAQKAFRVDETGRQSWSYDFRDILSTGSATLTRAQETSVLAGSANVANHIVTVSASNTSTSAQTVFLRSGTGGNITEVLVIPATSTIVKNYEIPLPASETSTSWTAQNGTSGEISDSPVGVSISAVKYNA